MTKVELQAEIERLQREILRRDRLLRTAYYRVRQIRDNKQQALLEAMQEWAPTAREMQPWAYSKGATT